jgi:hypothetical protein
MLFKPNAKHDTLVQKHGCTNMVAQKCIHYLRRIQDMGLGTAWWLTSNRIKKKYFLWRHRQHWLPNKYPSQANVTAQPPLFCLAILNDPLFQAALPNQFKTPESIQQLADQAAKPCIKLLGFGTFCFNNPIPWHSDVTTNQPSPGLWQTGFCSTITPQAGVDIKVPWELSRLQHLFHLGLGYRQAIQANNHKLATVYAAAVVTQITDWIDNNPYLIGVNWTNPMEVAIRSINLIWAWALFHDAPNIPSTFRQRLTAVLHGHQTYLAHTWEVSDRPNNHYLADLIGHAYLNALFGITNKKLIQTTISQFRHQTNHDGSCYEGSTAYHRLDTELLLHFILLCKYTHQPIPDDLLNRFTLMQTFLANCTDSNGNLVQIGDNDSGSIVAGLTPTTCQPPQQPVITTYKNFGLTVIKTPIWHITFRHPTYTAHQPTGHFHQDWLAITVNINGIPVFVDPGTYLYTANPTARNQFRSAASHNTFYPSSATLLAPDLFQLPRKPHGWTGTVTQSDSTITVADAHGEYKNYGVIAHRTLQLDTKNNVLTLEDWWEPYDAHIQPIAITWALHCAPVCGISPLTDGYNFDEKIDSPSYDQKVTVFNITNNKKSIATIATPCTCKAQPACFSPAYGSCQPITKLLAQTLWGFDRKRIEIRLV